MTSGLAGLLKRVEEAGEDDQWEIVGEAVRFLVPLTVDSEHWLRRVHAMRNAGGYVDSVLALIKRELPGWWWEVAMGRMSGSRGPYWARAYNSTDALRSFDGEPIDWPGPTPALALLAALIRAKLEGEKS